MPEITEIHTKIEVKPQAEPLCTPLVTMAVQQCPLVGSVEIEQQITNGVVLRVKVTKGNG